MKLQLGDFINMNQYGRFNHPDFASEHLADMVTAAAMKELYDSNLETYYRWLMEGEAITIEEEQALDLLMNIPAGNWLFKRILLYFNIHMAHYHGIFKAYVDDPGELDRFLDDYHRDLSYSGLEHDLGSSPRFVNGKAVMINEWILITNMIKTWVYG